MIELSLSGRKIVAQETAGLGPGGNGGPHARGPLYQDGLGAIRENWHM